jgi:hypothetical protein
MLMRLSLSGVLLVPFLLGCSSYEQTPALSPTAPAAAEIVGTLISVKDDRPVDGGLDLVLETVLGTRELVRVPSSFTAGPRDSIQAMHDVVDRAKIGDRLRARGTRDESGALRSETLELVTLPYGR